MPKAKDSRANASLKKALRKKQPERKELAQLQPEDLLSGGAATLDVCVSGRAAGGIYAKGLFTQIIGDTSTGKTWLVLTALSEAVRNEHFAGYKFVYDPSERGARMDIRRYFGAAVQEGIQGPPRGISRTVEDFYFNLEEAAREPCIYIIDSFDALSAEADVKKFNEASDKHAEGKVPETGSYGMAKAKANSVNLRLVPDMLEKTKSVLIGISQTRQNLGFGYAEKTKGGGLAFDFYADVQLWMSVREKLKKEVKLDGGEKKKRVYGTRVKVVVKKNRISGWEGDTEFTFLKNYGIDNVGSCVDYILEEGGWSKSQNGVIEATDLKVKMRRDALIEHVEANFLHKKLALAVKRVYKEIEKKTTPDRRPRYE